MKNKYLPKTENRSLLLLPFVLLICFIVYNPVLSFDYVWDDTLLFLDRTGLMNQPLSWDVLATPVLPGTSYFRPMVFFTFFSEFYVFGQSPSISHFVNLLIFLINGSCVYFLSCIILKNRYVLYSERSLVITVLYLFHPALMESTVWVSGRFDLLVTFFILGGLVVYFYFNNRLMKNSLVVLLFFLALLSKELAFVFPMVLFVFWMASNKNCDLRFFELIKIFFHKNTALIFGMFCVFVFYVFLRINAVGEFYHKEYTLSYFRNEFFSDFLPFQAILFYFTDVFFPFHSISILHPINESILDSKFFIAFTIICLLALFFLTYYAFLKKNLSALLAMAGFFLLLPVLHFVPLSIGGNVGHDRFLTAPLVFFLMSIGSLDFMFPKDRVVRILLIIIFSVWIFICILTIRSILPFWSNELQLWNWTYKLHQKSVMARGNYLYSSLKEKRDDLFLAEIFRLKHMNSGLNLTDKLMYSVYLIKKSKPEGLVYMEDFLYQIPKYHLLGIDPDNLPQQPMTKNQIGSAYYNYANGLLMLRGDAISASKYNNIAQWYFSDEEKEPLFYQKIAIEAALGSFDIARQQMYQLSHHSYYQKNDIISDIAVLLNGFCKVNEDHPPSCKVIHQHDGAIDLDWLQSDESKDFSLGIKGLNRK
jgi:hypothetical protein